VEITEVRIKLTEDNSERLQGFCSITIDHCFVVRDLKIIEGANGPFVAMPSRKLTAHCPRCGCKNHLRAAYCNQCGHRLRDERTAKEDDGRTRLYADIAHPINAACREMIQEKVIQAFREELEQAKLPGYVSRYDDPDEECAPPHPARRGAEGSEPRRTEPPAPHVKPRSAGGPRSAARAADESPAEAAATGRGMHVAAAGDASPPLSAAPPPCAEGQADAAQNHRSAEDSTSEPSVAAPNQARLAKRDNFGAGIW
jgi:stage V sporulation protein G